MKRPVILIVGGGTGGHISPGIALYEEFRERNFKSFILVGRKDLRFSSLGDVPREDLLSYRAPSFTKNILKIPFFLGSFLWAVLRAGRILRRLEIAAVVGMGGYVSGPALIAARMRKVPVYLCEQNSVPGRVTSFFTKNAKRIFTTFDVTRDYVKEPFREKLYHAGNPIRKKVLSTVPRDEAKNHFYLRHCRMVILAIGGSQGAVKINELILELKNQYADELKDIGIIWSTGDFSYDKFQGQIQGAKEKGSIYLSPFIDNVGYAYRASDLVIGRSGSGVMVETAAMGLPSILIPFPFAAQDHQEKNADVFERAGAAVKVVNQDATAAKVGPILFDLLNNPGKLERMSQRALAVAKAGAAADIVRVITADLA